MKYGICNQSVVSIRKEPKHQSEIVSQLLFNDTYEQLDEISNWILIRTDFDQYEGWIPANQHQEIDEESFHRLRDLPHYVTTQPITNYQNHLLSLGSLLYEETAFATQIPSSFDSELMVSFAKMLLHAPYLWGGKSVFGIDCSGLVQLCARMSGLNLPRNASQQAQLGDLVYFLPETKPGDLAFFSNDEGDITHVGILMEDEKIIHSSGCVRIDYIDQTGIFNNETKLHTHHLAVIKRMK